MKFSIVTLSFRNSRWPELCLASVADQQGLNRNILSKYPFPCSWSDRKVQS